MSGRVSRASRPRGAGRRAGSRARGGNPFSCTPLPSMMAASRASPATHTGSASGTDSTPSRSETSSDAVTLEGLFDLCKDTSVLIRTMNVRLRSVEDRTDKVTTAVKELNEYIKKYCKSSFAVKGSKYESMIKSEMSKLFLLNLERKPSDSDIKDAVARVLNCGNLRDRYRFDVVHTYAKNRLTEYRTEERRKVMGLFPSEKACYNDTKSLSDLVINAMLPPGSEIEIDKAVYFKNLVLLRKFVRDSGCIPQTNFYAAFRDWIKINFPTLNDMIWSELLEEDDNIDYNIVGSGIQEELEEVIEEEVIEDGEAEIPAVGTPETENE